MKKNKIICSIFSIAILGCCIAPVISSCSLSNKIVFANFESYMSEMVMNKLNKQYNVNFLSYNTNEDIKMKFEKYYDIAVPSSYIVDELVHDDLLAPIPWSDFDLDYVYDGATIIDGIDFGDLDGDGKISNAQEALSLFTSVPGLVQTLVNTYDLNDDGAYDVENDNLLLYSIPYFLQDMVFGYKTHAGEVEIDGNVDTWQEILTEISPNENESCSEYFQKNNNRPSLSMVDDCSTLYSISRLIETSNNTIYLDPDHDSKSDFSKTFSYLVDPFADLKDYFYLSSDGGLLAREFANPNGYNGLISYNGDVLYAITGAGEFEPLDYTEASIIRPTQNVAALDMIVINKNVIGTSKEQDAYDIVKQVALDGYDVQHTQDIVATDKDGEFIYSTMENFDVVEYTPVLNSVYNFITYEGNEQDVNAALYDYWGLSSGDTDNLRFYQNILKVDLSKCMLEHSISDLQKSDMHWAYIEARAKL